MADVVLVALIVAFIAICVAYVSWCSRIIGTDDAVGDAPVRQANERDLEPVVVTS